MNAVRKVLDVIRVPSFERFAIERVGCALKGRVKTRMTRLEREVDEVLHIVSPGPLDSPQFSTPVSQLKKDFQRGYDVIESARKRYPKRRD